MAAKQVIDNSPTRLLCWFSCGSTSALATKLALKKYRGKMETIIAYCDTGSEHRDNVRFIKDCEGYFDHEITILKSENYEDIWDVFEKTRYLAGVKGARCTTELKKRVRQSFEDLTTDLQVFGFDVSEASRAERFISNNPEVNVIFPLIEENLTKQDCLNDLQDNGVNIPIMYKLGYKNNNCIGCVKGQAGYWNKIRLDFPEVFDRMAKIERKLNVALCKSYAGDGKRKRVFLDELSPETGRYKNELNLQCGLFCGE